MAIKEAALRKRQQIASANRMMFMWVAGASIVVGFAFVGGYFLVQKLAFNQKVINEKNNTVAVLKKNNATVEELRNNIRLLNTNQSLNDTKAPGEDKALQVVLDALPADANSLALASSLQNKLVNGINGLSLDSLKVNPAPGEGVSTSSTKVQDATKTSKTTNSKVTFQLVASSRDSNALKQLLQRFESSIRAIDIDDLTLESSGGKLTLTVGGHAYYEPAVNMQLIDKVVKP
jgi:hypothetical protein